MSDPVTRMVCSACGAESRAVDELPFRCPAAQAGDDIDHVLQKVIELGAIRFAREDSEHPFLRYRELLHSYQFARENGLEDSEWEELVTQLDESIRSVDGAGLTRTPFARNDALSDEFGFSKSGGVWVKDETGQFSGSHKSRHLFGVAIYLAAFERLGFLASGGEQVLAIASCGNAALAAAVVARAIENPLEVFIPTGAEQSSVARLGALGARTVVCPRVEGEAGDPCTARLASRLESGALPFTVQGSENGLVVEGGSTLAYEIMEASADAGVELDRVFIQVGGGALASSCIQGFGHAECLRIAKGPLVQTVQTLASPLLEAYQRAKSASGQHGSELLNYAAQNRSEFMQPLAEEPTSLASGILDDETYDWRAILAHALEHEAEPIVCGEERFAEATALANRVGESRVSATGAASLAGLMELKERGGLNADENVAVLFTGAER